MLVIYAQSQATIWLLVKEDRYSGGGLGRPDKTVSQVIFDVSLQCFQLYRPEAIDRVVWELSIIH